MTSKSPTRPAARSAGRRDRRATARRADRASRTTSTESAVLAQGHRRHGEELRIDMATAILDRLDIARHLLRLQPVDTRIALALQLLEQTTDDVADLAGMP